jgi:hypothetical protein
MSTQRTRLAIPIDIPRTQYDSTVTQTQIDNNVVLGSSDDRDTLASMIEDAEAEFRTRVDADMEIARKGVPGDRPTFEQTTYKISGHKLTKGTFTGTWTDYYPTQQTMLLDEQNVLPFDSAEDDAVYLYKGLDETNPWEDVTADKGDIWDILDYREGRFTFSPARVAEEYIDTVSTARGTVPSFLKRIRFAVTYRYGSLGGDKSFAGSTSLDASLTQSQTGTVAVTDASRLPTTLSGDIILLVDREYIRATVDAQNDEIDVLERGVRGTNDTGHSSGDGVSYTPGAVRKAIAARAGVSLAQSGRYQAFVPDADDSLDRSDIISRMQDTWEGTITALSGGE